MTANTFISFTAAFVALIAAQPAGHAQSVSRLVQENETVLRVPVQPQGPRPTIEWVERKGPACIPVRAIRRATLASADKVDFVLLDRVRIRAKFDDRCPALDFYGGFYLRTEDQKLCAGRDAVHSRMGGDCTIEQFKHLVPRVKR